MSLLRLKKFMILGLWFSNHFSTKLFMFYYRRFDWHYLCHLDCYITMVQGCKTKVGLRNILCSIQKEQKGWWKRLLKSEEKPAPYIKVDWNKWCDEDGEESSCKLIAFSFLCWVLLFEHFSCASMLTILFWLFHCIRNKIRWERKINVMINSWELMQWFAIEARI